MEFLPIGSVVLLKEATKKIMVIGYLATDRNTQKKYDYIACLYPEGLMSSKEFYMFNKDKIDKVIFEGYKE